MYATPSAFANSSRQATASSIVPSPSHLIGRAYLSGVPNWVSDLSRMTDWNRRDVALAAGLQTGVVIPVMAHGHVAAFIEFYSDQRVDATNAWLELVEAIGAELSRVAERQRAERELRQREVEASRLAMVASRTEQMVLILDTLGRIEWANDAVMRFSGHRHAGDAGQAGAHVDAWGTAPTRSVIRPHGGSHRAAASHARSS